MKTASDRLERQALLSLMGASDEMTTSLFVELKDEHFSTTATAEIWTKCRAYINASKPIPQRSLFCTDPSLSEESRNLIGMDNPVIGLSEIPELVGQLTEYSQLRSSMDIANKLSGLLTSEEVNVEDIRHLLLTGAEKLDLASGDDVKTLHLGEGSTIDHEDYARSLLQKGSDVIPTGITEFDAVAGGFARGDLVVITSAPANAKTTMAINIATNYYEQQHFNVAYFTFEVPTGELVRRVMSKQGRVPYQLVRKHSALNPCMTESQINQTVSKWCEFTAPERKGSFEFLDSGGMSATRVIAEAKSRGCDLIVIDQLTMMDDPSLKQEQWQMYGTFSRQLKQAAKDHQMIVILIAQRAEDKDQIRYARTVKEYADVVFTWDLDEDAHAGHPAEVRSMKARNTPPFNFKAIFELDYQNIKNPTKLKTSTMPKLTRRAAEDILDVDPTASRPSIETPTKPSEPSGFADLDAILNEG